MELPSLSFTNLKIQKNLKSLNISTPLYNFEFCKLTQEICMIQKFTNTRNIKPMKTLKRTKPKGWVRSDAEVPTEKQFLPSLDMFFTGLRENNSTFLCCLLFEHKKGGRIKALKKGKCRKLKFEGFSSPPINPCLAQAYPDRKVLNHRGSFAGTYMDGTSCPTVVPLLPTKMKDRRQNKTTKNQKKHQSFLSVGALATPKVWFLNRPFLNKNKNI